MLQSRALQILLESKHPVPLKLSPEETEGLFNVAITLMPKGILLRINSNIIQQQTNGGAKEKWLTILRLPLSINWRLIKVFSTEAHYQPFVVADHRSHFDVGLSLLGKMTEVYKTNHGLYVADLGTTIVSIPAESWRTNQEPFYCLPSERDTLVKQRILELIDALGS